MSCLCSREEQGKHGLQSSEIVLTTKTMTDFVRALQTGVLDPAMDGIEYAGQWVAQADLPSAARKVFDTVAHIKEPSDFIVSLTNLVGRESPEKAIELLDQASKMHFPIRHSERLVNLMGRVTIKKLRESREYNSNILSGAAAGLGLLAGAGAMALSKLLPQSTRERAIELGVNKLPEIKQQKARSRKRVRVDVGFKKEKKEETDIIPETNSEFWTTPVSRPKKKKKKKKQ